LVDEWLTVDDFNREWGGLIFTAEADLFLPAGGRPETVDEGNCHLFFAADGTPSMRTVVEGANSFFTPAARLILQKTGIVILRDASANKCGVISSSYEIIANLLLTEKEFLAHKESYVGDVLKILERRAEEEAKLIFQRRNEPGCSLLWTEISAAISREINAHYAHLFEYFQKNPQHCEDPLFRRAILAHLPLLLQENRRYRQRLRNLPAKYRYAILACEIASSLVYRGDREAEFAAMLQVHLARRLAA
jgi:glutamate dehydrogenase